MANRTKAEREIELRAVEIQAEGYFEGRQISWWKALSQATREWKEYSQKTKKVRLF
jgi:hypothetical protein